MEEMEIFQRTNEAFEEGVCVKITRMESLSTIWVRIRGWPRITYILNWEMTMRPNLPLPDVNDLAPGMFVAVLVNLRRNCFWERGILLEQTQTGYTVFLIDWGFKTKQDLSTIHWLPERYTTTAPWARKIRLRGVQDQEWQLLKHRIAQRITLRKRTGYLFNIDTSPGDAMTATLLLNWREGEMPRDVGAYWLRQGFLDPI
jgi:hypothetical protein